MTRIPLFPLRTVLCPGVALPLHIFEDRYRLMVGRCLERGEVFGVVLIREGPEVGPSNGAIAAVGTTAAIRRVGNRPDGRLDILTVGQRRFRLDAVDHISEPYLLGQVRYLDEQTGPEAEVRRQAERVGRHFLEYLELMHPEGAPEGPEVEIEFEIDVDAAEMSGSSAEDPDEPGQARGAEEASALSGVAPGTARAEGPLSLEGADLTPAQRRELLLAAARHLMGTDDPTALSYVLTALLQVDLASRQALLEAPDTAARLLGLERHLVHERWFLRQGLRPILIDPGQPGRQVS